MQRGPDKMSRIVLLIALIALALTMVLYFIKRSEVNGIYTNAKLEKKHSQELEQSLNHKLNEQEQKLKMMQQQIDNYKTQIGKCEDQLLVSDKEMDSKDKSVQQCKQEQEDVKKQLSSCQEELTPLKESNSKSQKDLETEKLNSKTLQTRLEKCQEGATSAEKCLGQLSLAKTNLKTCQTNCQPKNDDVLQRV